MTKMWVSNKACLVNTQGKVLVCRLKDGRADLPGGRMEQGEEMREALAREVYEETKIVIDVAKARPFYAGVFPYKGTPPEPVATVF